MNDSRRTLICPTLSAVMMLALAAGATPAAQPLPGAPAQTSGRIIIRTVDDGDLASINQRYGTRLIQSIPSQNVFLLQLPPQVNEAVLLASFEGEERVAWAEMNHAHTAPGGSTQSFFVSSTALAYEEQYAPRTLDLATSHEIADGTGVVVAVLDTGVSPQHPLLAGRLTENGANFINPGDGTLDLGNGLDDDGDGFIDEMMGHGTFVAGLIVTVAPEARIMPVTVLNSDGVGAAFYVAQGIYHATANGADVINLSLVSIRDSLAVREAIVAARRAGVIVVAAVGNDARQSPAPYPAAGNLVIAVAATDAQDRKAAFSDYGSFVDLCAPGLDVISALPGGGYARASGASFSAALTSGAAALLRGAAPLATLERVETLLVGSAASIDHLNHEYAGLLGRGRVRPAAALVSIIQRPICDFNGDGKIDSTDLMEFVTAWLGQRPAGDMTKGGKIDSADLLVYVDAWLKCAR